MLRPKHVFICKNKRFDFTLCVVFGQVLPVYADKSSRPGLVNPEQHTSTHKRLVLAEDVHRIRPGVQLFLSCNPCGLCGLASLSVNRRTQSREAIFPDSTRKSGDNGVSLLADVRGLASPVLVYKASFARHTWGTCHLLPRLQTVLRGPPAPAMQRSVPLEQ